MKKSSPLHALWVHRSRLNHAPIRLNQRVCIMRNLEGIPFPSHANAQQRTVVMETIKQALQQVWPKYETDWIQQNWNSTPHSEREMLRFIGDLEHPCEATVHGYHKRRFEQIIINDMDHVRFQSMKPNGSLKQQWAALGRLEEALEASLKYAFSPSYGYWTHSPQTLGIGLKASMVLHLPGLCFERQLPTWIGEVAKMHLRLEPLYLCNDKVVGHLFRLSTAVGLGCSEEDLLDQLESAANRICETEQQMRNNMLARNRLFVQDSVGRSLGVLQNCCELGFEEGVNLLSIMVMAIDDGLLPHYDRTALTTLWCSLSPEGLQALGEKVPTPEEAACMRANLVKDYFAQQKLPTADLQHQAIETASVKRKGRVLPRKAHQTQKKNIHVV